MTRAAETCRQASSRQRTATASSRQRTATASDPAFLDVDTLFASLACARGLLLAVSGGPDSSALLLLIDRWRRRTGTTVSVATVDHRLREGSDHEAALVARWCAARNLPHRTLVRHGAPFRTRVQERAREARYALLEAHAVAIGADTIVTGHHADDQAETVLMRLLRGSGLAGLAGMAATPRGPVTLARPLLAISKSALVALCQLENLDFVEDPSNADDAFRRTALRRLMPVLASEGLGERALNRLGARAARTEAALRWADAQASDRLRAQRTSTGMSVSAEDFAALPEELAIRFVAAEIGALSPDASIRLGRLETLVAALRSAVSHGTPFAATLAGCVVRLRAATVFIALAPPRRPSRAPIN